MNTEEYVKKLEEENKELKEKLKTYTAPARRKTYYENHRGKKGADTELTIREVR